MSNSPEHTVLKYVDLYSASSRSASLISVSQPYSQASANTARPRDTGWCITRYACLLPQCTPGTHSSLGRLRLSSLGAWFRAELV